MTDIAQFPIYHIGDYANFGPLGHAPGAGRRMTALGRRSGGFGPEVAPAWAGSTRARSPAPSAEPLPAPRALISPDRPASSTLSQLAACVQRMRRRSAMRRAHARARFGCRPVSGCRKRHRSRVETIVDRRGRAWPPDRGARASSRVLRATSWVVVDAGRAPGRGGLSRPRGTRGE